jgi:serine/threonine protein kinase/predicted hydrocarbon binding protein
MISEVTFGMAAEKLSTTASLVGQTLGRYQIQSRLATGGMADLWLALVAPGGKFGRRGGRKVVLKTMLPEMAGSPDFVRMFQTEAAIGARLKHPNLVGIIDHGRLCDRFYIAMEHIDGLNLRQLGRRLQEQAAAPAPVIPVSLLLPAIIDICRGLDSAHHCRDRSGPLQFVHRDVSPENIMIARSGAAKLIDFGAARTARLASSGSRFVGKLAYVAPERLNGVGEDLRCDVYSVGVVLYEALTGVKPFDGVEESMIARILAGRPRPIDQQVTGMPRGLSAIVARALARSSADRYPSAAALADDLQALLNTMTTSAAVLPTWPFDHEPAPAPEIKTVSMAPDLLRGMVRETREEETVVRDLTFDERGRRTGVLCAPAPRVTRSTPPTEFTPVPMTAVGPPPCAQASAASSWMFERRRSDDRGRDVEAWLRPDRVRRASVPAVTALEGRIDIAHALQLARPNLGRVGGLALYRVLRQVALQDGGSGETACLAGKKLGHSLGLTTIDDFLSLCGSLKIGIIRMPVVTDAGVHIDIYECATCSGVAGDHVGCPMCQFEGGLIAGVLENVVKRRTRVQEVSCIGGLGDEACGFDLEFG